MNDLISRQAAVKALQDKVFHNLSDEFYGAMQVLDELPPVDAVPVKHGHWIDDHDFARCSLCNRIIYDAYYEFRDKNDASFHNYCPYCGAKMDEKHEGKSADACFTDEPGNPHYV